MIIKVSLTLLKQIVSLLRSYRWKRTTAWNTEWKARRSGRSDQERSSLQVASETVSEQKKWPQIQDAKTKLPWWPEGRIEEGQGNTWRNSDKNKEKLRRNTNQVKTDWGV